MDWSILERDDFLFGPLQEQSHFVYPKEGGDEHESTDKGVYPDVEMQTKVDDLRAGRFLRGEIYENGSESFWDLTGRKGGAEEEKEGKQDGPVWVHTFVRNLRGNRWTAEQVIQCALVCEDLLTLYAADLGLRGHQWRTMPYSTRCRCEYQGPICAGEASVQVRW